MPSRTAARDEARFTTSVLPDTPASPRDRPASSEPAARPEDRRASRDSRNLAVEDLGGDVGGHVAGRHAGAADGDDEVDAADDRGVERVADLHLVGRHRDDGVDDEACLVQQLCHQGSDGVLAVTVSGAVVDDYHQRAAGQRGFDVHGPYRSGPVQNGLDLAENRRCSSAAALFGGPERDVDGLGVDPFPSV